MRVFGRPPIFIAAAVALHLPLDLCPFGCGTGIPTKRCAALGQIVGIARWKMGRMERRNCASYTLGNSAG